MHRSVVTAIFEVRGEAERAHFLLRAMGVPDARVSITGGHDGDTDTRDDEVGVPDAAGGLSDLQGSPSSEPGHDESDGSHAPLVYLTADLSGLDVDMDQVKHIFSSQGGRLQ